MRRDRALLFLLGCLVIGLFARLTPQPGYMDAYYYFNGALRLARGFGFTEAYVWNYLSPVASLPAPSHLYWMPLTSIISAPFIALMEWWAGTALPNDALFRAAQIPMVLAASAFPLLSYAVALAAAGQRRHALAAALLTLFSAFYFPFWPSTDAFALYGLTAGGALFCFGRACEAPEHKWFFVSGLLAGLAHLARADGVLVVACLMTYGAWRFSRASRPTLRQLLLTLFGYGLVTAPWLLRNWLTVGALTAPGATRALWLTEYNDLFSYPADVLTFSRYLSLGWMRMAQDKWAVLVANFQSLAAVQSSIIAFPLAVVGAWVLRRGPVYQLAWLYQAALFAAMTFVFTFPGFNGAYFHSGVALVPFIFSAALAGLDASVEAVARRLKHWQPEKSKPIFTALFVLGCLMLTAARTGATLTRPASAKADAVYEEIGAWLKTAGAGEAVVAVNNPPAYYYLTGQSCIVVPGGGPEALLGAMDQFGARWAVLDVNHASGMARLYQSPESEPRLTLRAAFADGAGRPVYLFERAP